MKGTTYKKQSEYSANNTLKRFFAKYPDSNSLTINEVFEGVDRNTPEYANKNDNWLSNKLTGLYAHSLVRPHYTFNPWRKLESIELTQKGKAVLGREDAPISNELTPPPNKQAHDELTIDDILAAIPKINEKLKTHKLRVTLEEVGDK